MNSYKSILTMERCRTVNFAAGVEAEKNKPCPVCGGDSWDYLMKDKEGLFVGCDDCLRKIYS